MSLGDIILLTLVDRVTVAITGPWRELSCPMICCLSPSLSFFCSSSPLSLVEIRSHVAHSETLAKAGLELLILPVLPPEHWDYGHAPSRLLT